MQRSTLAVLLTIFSIGCPLAGADTVFSIARDAGVGGRYTAGATVDVTVTVNLATTDGTLNALGLEERIPDGWTFNSLVSGQQPDLAPFAGEGDLLEFSWIFSLPENFPFNFTYRLNVPPGQAGSKPIEGQAIALISEQEFETPTVTTFLVPEGLGPYHSSDIDENQVLSLGELLRTVQFYNAGGYRCALETEDGFNPGTDGNTACDPHTADYAPADYTIALSELLRHIQTFNAGFYTFCPTQGTEDGFCPLAP